MSQPAPIRTARIQYKYEDELPDMPESDFDTIFRASAIDFGVRVYPFIETDDGEVIWLFN